MSPICFLKILLDLQLTVDLAGHEKKNGLQDQALQLL